MWIAVSSVAMTVRVAWGDFSLQACFILSCQAMSSHGGRVSNMQKPLASAIQKKSMEGFFSGVLRGIGGARVARCGAMEPEGGTPESP